MKDLKSNIWENAIGKKLLLIAMSLALLTHGVILYFTMPKTYDAFVHIFFADHYARFWFEPWEYRWYTGFFTTSYPPFVHQMIALISKLFPLKVAFCIYAILIYEILLIGIYRFSKLFYNKTIAGVATLIALVLSSIIETLHVFGQMPTLTGLAFLLNALPFLYQYFLKLKPIYLATALSFLAVVVSSHHVTAIFGMVFFIAPTIFMALYDGLNENEKNLSLILQAKAILFSAFKKYKQLILFGLLMGILAISFIFPYWYWSKTDPINQVSIPHGSRDNFLKNISSGLVFYIIPLSLIFTFLPAIAYSILKQKRFIGWAVSFFLCLLLGSGGTTPIPKLILGANAFNILTLDRFGFWASIIAIPFMAKYIYSFLDGTVRNFWISKFSTSFHFILSGLCGFLYFIFLIFVFHLASFRALQPKEIDIQPILNFINRDEHIRWRFLTLGFGDQMAWLSANSLAASVDGNYHSARRLPELTTRPIERLENSKFIGVQGLASLNDFLCEAEKYNLKYVFSNDKYYDPLLYYSGWTRNIRLENGIMVWEKGNITTIKPFKPKELSPILKKVWGILPLSSIFIAIFFSIFYLVKNKKQEYYENAISDSNSNYPTKIIYACAILPILFFSSFLLKQIYELLFINEHKDPKTTVVNYYNHLDLQQFEDAFHFFKPSLLFTIDQYLLEKSVKDGGLLPNYAKLDSINVIELNNKNNNVDTVAVFTNWNTSLGYQIKKDTLALEKIKNKWYIIPKKFEPEIPELQVGNYNYLFFKKMGKRNISSFPTVKDDRIKKAFAAFKQIHLIQTKNENYITGELLNADDIPINIAVRVNVVYKNNINRDYYPTNIIQYNLAPKSFTFFKINLENPKLSKLLSIEKINVFVETDISEKGYLHGCETSFNTTLENTDSVIINANVTNQLTTEINIPGFLIAQKDSIGNILNVALGLYPQAIRSGLSLQFNIGYKKQQAQIINQYPINIFINGSQREVNGQMNIDEIANENNGIIIKPHSFMAQEIFLQ